MGAATAFCAKKGERPLPALYSDEIKLSSIVLFRSSHSDFTQEAAHGTVYHDNKDVVSSVN